MTSAAKRLDCPTQRSRCAAALRSAVPLWWLALVLLLAGCATSQGSGGGSAAATSTAADGGTLRAAHRRPVHRLPPYPLVLARGLAGPGPTFTPVVRLRGDVAAWLAMRAGVTLIRFNPRLAHLALHAGSLDPGGSGWQYADRVTGIELHHLIAAFNAGFRLNTSSGGFQAQGRTPVPLQAGLGSVVTYTDGTTQIGAWQADVPTPGKTIASVRQNLHLLINAGAPAPTANSCARTCWGPTLGGGVDVARSALGITSTGDLVYAAGASLSPSTLANAMVSAGVQRAIELDINPEWVAAYLYRHGASTPRAVPLVPGQHGIAGYYLQPYSRDYFTIITK